MQAFLLLSFPSSDKDDIPIEITVCSTTLQLGFYVDIFIAWKIHGFAEEEHMFRERGVGAFRAIVKSHLPVPMASTACGAPPFEEPS